MSTDSISPILFCTPFESKIILYFTAKLLEESKVNSSDAENLLDEVKDLFLDEMSLHILNKELFLPSKEESNEEMKRKKKIWVI